MIFVIQCTEVRFASFISISGRFIIMAIKNPPEKKLAKHTSVQCIDIFSGQAVNRYSLNYEKSFRFDIHCKAYETERLFVLFLLSF